MKINFHQKVYWRLAFGLFFVFGLFGAFMVWVVSTSIQDQQDSVLQRMHHHLSHHVVDHYLFFKQGEVDLDSAKHTFHDLMILGPNFEFYVLDKEGKILTYSAEKHKIKRTHVALEPIHTFMGLSDVSEPIYGEDPRSGERTKPFTATAIKQDGETVGYLYVILGSEIRDALSQAVIQNRITYWIVAAIVIGALASFCLALMVTRVVTKPLTRLTRQVKKVKAIGFAKQSETVEAQSVKNAFSDWHPGNQNEIHILGSAFKNLVDELEQQYKHVLEVDEMRKELLTHISHDLRTPLASLMGYLETWELNKHKVDVEQSDKYISVARRNAERISKLVAQLFELAHLDSGKVTMRFEQCAIAELAQDVIQKLSLQAEAKQIDLVLEPQDNALTVAADIEKLERVFTNLIENAIRHSKEGGKISIKLAVVNGRVSIEVSDNGIGIPKEDLPYVFNAHYKAGNSVRGDTAHGGIGLAITKKIIDLHNSTIDVVSRVNEGTTFRFTLPSVA